MNMIKDDGALHGVIPKEKATWFDFLTLTRATNSLEGMTGIFLTYDT